MSSTSPSAAVAVVLHWDAEDGCEDEDDDDVGGWDGCEVDDDEDGCENDDGKGCKDEEEDDNGSLL